MIKFENRKAEHLNRKNLNVVEVIRDGGGEIINLVVDVSRMEGMIEQEGTPLNAESLNTIITNYVEETVMKVLHAVLTSERKIELDLNNIEMVDYMCPDNCVNLLSEGVLGTKFTWSVVDGDITIENNILSVENDIETDQNTKIKVTARYGDEVKNKEYSIKLLGSNNIETPKLKVCPDGSSSAYAVFDIESNSEVFIENDYSFLVSTNILENNKLEIFFGSEFPEGGVREFSFKVIVKDKTTGETTKEIRITVEFLNSVEGED